MRPLRRSIRRAASRRLRRLLAPTVGVGLFLASSTAWAQTQPAPTQAPPQTQPQEDITLPGVDVRGQGGRNYRAPSSDLFKLPDLLKDTPQSITVVPQQIIREE